MAVVRMIGSLTLWVTFLIVPLIFGFKILAWIGVAAPLIHRYMVAVLFLALGVLFLCNLAPIAYQAFVDNALYKQGSWMKPIAHAVMLLIFTIILLAVGIAFLIDPRKVPF